MKHKIDTAARWAALQDIARQLQDPQVRRRIMREMGREMIDGESGPSPAAPGGQAALPHQPIAIGGNG